jgi:putative endonuclease
VKAPPPLRQNNGALAEDIAARYLQERGLKLITRNYRCRLGEIDLILQDGDALVFAEVRMRSNRNFGGAAASIDSRKQTKLIRAAQHYLSTLPHIPPCRFDAVLLSSPTRRPLLNPLPQAGEEASEPLREYSDIEWVRNAFGA